MRICLNAELHFELDFKAVLLFFPAWSEGLSLSTQQHKKDMWKCVFTLLCEVPKEKAALVLVHTRLCP